MAHSLRALESRTDRQLNLPAGAIAVLHILHSGPLTVPQIARMRSTFRQNTQLLVDRLETLGHVERSSNPAHRKSSLVTLTEQGKELMLRLSKRDLPDSLSKAVNEETMLATAEVLRQVRHSLQSLETRSISGRRPRIIVKPQKGPARKARRDKHSLAAPAEMVESPPVLPWPEDAQPDENQLPVNLL